eukprot:TRINITY_DN11707_c0_g1_i11.p2 TRINITY_DN11707_c0_g1~~TRINITY_DN11707_c0_g1_i11.p2  ORF type:complete len:266 (+),score=-38.15 TRINITY_DN11707_c0_g1_i11:60-857(+)
MYLLLQHQCTTFLQSKQKVDPSSKFIGHKKLLYTNHLLRQSHSKHHSHYKKQSTNTTLQYYINCLNQNRYIPKLLVNYLKISICYPYKFLFNIQQEQNSLFIYYKNIGNYQQFQNFKVLHHARIINRFRNYNQIYIQQNYNQKCKNLEKNKKRTHFLCTFFRKECHKNGQEIQFSQYLYFYHKHKHHNSCQNYTILYGVFKQQIIYYCTINLDAALILLLKLLQYKYYKITAQKQVPLLMQLTIQHDKQHCILQTCQYSIFKLFW